VTDLDVSSIGFEVVTQVPTVPADNLMVHAALSFVKIGDIIVVDARGTPYNKTTRFTRLISGTNKWVTVSQDTGLTLLTDVSEEVSQ
jgi:hypothetical protein